MSITLGSPADFKNLAACLYAAEQGNTLICIVGSGQIATNVSILGYVEEKDYNELRRDTDWESRKMPAEDVGMQKKLSPWKNEGRGRKRIQWSL